MNTNKTKFINFYFNTLPTLTKWVPLFEAMSNTTEGSPWHREDTVAIHTNMVVSQFIAINDCPNFIIGALACAFHDVGKPSAMEAVFSEERGHYKRFHGHEAISARLWEDFALEHFQVLEQDLGLNLVDVFRVGWMIEHHLPYGVKKTNKVQSLLRTCSEYNLTSFFDVLLADCYGRLSDDAEVKRANTAKWIKEFAECELDEVAPKDDNKILYMLIGASGSGKSTFSKTIENSETFSLDSLRLDWYAPLDGTEKDRYSKGYQGSCSDDDFSKKANGEFIRMVKDPNVHNLIVDNTNVTPKSRAFFITEAKKRGFTIRGVMFPISLSELSNRHYHRDDKNVPWEAVTAQYMRIRLPSLGEVDEISFWNGNEELL